MYTGVCVLSTRLLARIPPGETALVRHLWQPLLDAGEETIGFLLHDGAFADLGRPRDFLRATFEALARGGPFPEGGGEFDRGKRVLARQTPDGIEVADSVLGRAPIGRGAVLRRSAVWDGAAVGEGARLTNCLVARGRVPAGAQHDEALLWAGSDVDEVGVYPLSGLGEIAHGFQPLSPRR